MFFLLFYLWFEIFETMGIKFWLNFLVFTTSDTRTFKLSPFNSPGTFGF